MDSEVDNRKGFDSQRLLLFDEMNALARKVAAPNSLAAIQNWVDLLGLLGVKNGGIPL